MAEVEETTKSIVRKILDRLVSDYAPEKVILYGSYAHGNPDRDSDIDLLIIKETTERFIDRWVTVQQILTGTHHSKVYRSADFRIYHSGRAVHGYIIE